jgi:hypothetical protein
VAEYTFISGGITFINTSEKTIQHFEHLLNSTAIRNCFYSLTSQQCEQCLDELIRDEALTSKANRPLLLQPCNVSKWRFNGQEIATNSHINLYYGTKACISTLLQFDTIDQFHYIKHVMEDLHFCKLNEKHLKLIISKTGE